MDVAHQVAQLLSEETGIVSIFCKPDCADTICAYGILKVRPILHLFIILLQLLLFHYCREMIGYTDCISDEILLHNIRNAQEKARVLLKRWILRLEM